MEDLAERVEHKVANVAAEHVCDTALLVAEGFDKRGPRVCSKTTVVAPSNEALTKAMAKRARGLLFEKGKSVRDLGVDNAGRCKGWRTATQKQRFAKLARRTRRLQELAACDNGARTFWNTNVFRPTVA